MVTGATGTPTTNYALPTFQGDVDNPNAVGLNNIIADLDTKLKTQFDAADASIASKPGIGIIVALGG